MGNAEQGPAGYTPEPEPWMIEAGHKLAKFAGLPQCGDLFADYICICRDRDKNKAELQDLRIETAFMEAKQ